MQNTAQSGIKYQIHRPRWCRRCGDQCCSIVLGPGKSSPYSTPYIHASTTSVHVLRIQDGSYPWFQRESKTYRVFSLLSQGPIPSSVYCNGTVACLGVCPCLKRLCRFTEYTRKPCVYRTVLSWPTSAVDGIVCHGKNQDSLDTQR